MVLFVDRAAVLGAGVMGARIAEVLALNNVNVTLKDIDDAVPVIVMTAFGSIEDAVRAMKDGAMDFLAKPVDPDHLLLLVERALAQFVFETSQLQESGWRVIEAQSMNR